jgi:hypothetical protein
LAVAAVMVTVQRRRWYGKMDMSDNKYVEREDVRKRRKRRRVTSFQLS